ncbi:uncharacterized protein VTP21DRAFT_6791 [Calcarisporiella thermophila]|uniref:uncharacterized protein n=1 Tax=Calcarisporiella thermophila TaxID=911321 RepID=UPI003741F787
MVKLLASLSALFLFSNVVALPWGLTIQRPFQLGAKDFGLRLISTSEDSPPVWMTELQIQFLRIRGKKFMDVTDSQDFNPQLFSIERPVIPKEASHKDEVKSLINNLAIDGMKLALTKFSSFHNRYYKSKYGAQSAAWLYSQVKEIAEAGPTNVTVAKFEHEWDQFSIIAQFPGTSHNASEEIVIVGAHQDSVNMWFPSQGRAPGADDDGSGTVTTLEAFRVLVEAGFAPERTVEFHWYSAEEAGLLGSQAVSRAYRKSSKRVAGMLQNDMTGWVGKQESFGVVNDYTDKELTSLIKRLIEAYAAIPWRDTTCGYACSDHGSWAKVGYASAFAFESKFEDSDPYIHSTSDTMDRLSFNHMKEFAKLSVAFAVEMGYSQEKVE